MTEKDQGFAGLRALYINTSLKRDGGKSHTRLLMGASAEIMEKNGVSVEHLHLLDHQVPPGVYPDMTEQGWRVMTGRRSGTRSRRRRSSWWARRSGSARRARSAGC